MKKVSKPESKSLRQKAEKVVKNHESKVASYSETDIRKLNHELRVHQIELEIMNEELIEANELAATAAEKYTELYDFAPSGYLTLSDEGIILELNLKAASLLGKERQRLVNTSFGVFLSKKTKPIFNSFLRHVYEGKIEESCVVTISIPENKQESNVLLIAYHPKKGDQCHLSMVDITTRKKAEFDLIKAKERAEINEEKFRILFENSPIGKSMTGIDGSLNVNKAFCEIVGYSEEELLNKKWKEISYAEDVPLTNKKIESLLKGEAEKVFFEKRYIHKNGGIIWAAVSTYLKRNVENQPEYFITSIIDITERKLSEEKLQLSIIHWNRTFDAIQDGITLLDTNQNIIQSNQAFLDIIKKPENEVLNHPCFGFVHGTSCPVKDCPFVRMKESKMRETMVLEANSMIFEVTVDPIFDNNENISGAVHIVKDITKDKQVESELIKAKEESQQSEERFQLAMKASSDGLFDWNLKTNSIYYSSGWKKMLGYEDHELPNDFSVWEETTSKEDVEKSWKLQKKLISGEIDRFVMEFKMKHKDGHWVDILSRAEAFFDAKGKAIRIVGTHSNITESKRVKQELIEAKEKAEESDRLKSAFLTNMSHEIRTPMNGILGFAELLKEPSLSSDDQKHYIEIMGQSGERMLNTINSIIDISKIESGLMNVSLKESNINEKMEFTYKFFKPLAEKKGIQLLFKNGLPDKEAKIITDNEKVYGILTNLIRNAIKFTQNGSIEFGYVLKSDSEPGSTEQGSSAHLEFYIKDTGSGISEQQKKIIFERFRQGSELHTRGYEGSGLGLSISKSYVEMLGGNMWVESQEGLGSTFYFTIPYNMEPETDTEIKDAASPEPKEVEVNHGISGLKILIVEDDEISYSLLSLSIDKISTEVLHAITGVEAVEACKNNPDLDLVLMDIRMPEMNGLEATQQIRKFNKDLIIIAQTAYGFVSDCKMALDAGCNDYISKPINMTQLYELIKKHVNKV